MGSQRENLHNLVERTVRATIKEHGPIESRWASSAAKRIAGALVDSQWDGLAGAAAVERLHKRIAEMKHGHARTVDENRRLRERLAACTCPHLTRDERDLMTAEPAPSARSPE